MTESGSPKLYNLLVSGDPNAWTRGEHVYDLSRYLEHTDDALKARFKSLDERVIAELTSLPALIAYETPVGAPARVGWLKTVEPRQRDVRLTYAFDPTASPIQPEKVESLAWPLRIEDWELNRTHWAVKEADLLDVLTRANALIAGAKVAKGEYAFSRQTLLKACDILGTLGHAELDRFVLEIGVAGLDASRGRGSRAQRANVLAEYVLAHADERTVEGDPLAMVIVREAAKCDPTYPEERYGIDLKTREGFWTALKKDGYAFADGQVVADLQPEPDAPPYAAPIAPAVGTASARSKRKEPMKLSRSKVFIVHGRDDGAKHEVARFIERLGLDAVILHEQANRGRTLLSKFLEEANSIDFAVVLMTPDDSGELAGVTPQKPRARQNVVFELGFFIAKLGAGRVCALVVNGVERPSDFEAVVYVAYGPNTAWKTELAKELREAGVSFDSDKFF